MAAYKRLYINVESNNQRTASAAIAKNLIALVVGATLGEETSLEKLISEFVTTKEIGKGVFQVSAVTNYLQYSSIQYSS